jgi:hypothetical protein
MYQICGEDIINQVVSGNNVSVIAYGQTSSGKTYTMFGPKNNQNEKGLIPRILQGLMKELELQRVNEGWVWKASCVVVEIYKNEVYNYDAKPNKANLIKFLETSIA